MSTTRRHDIRRASSPRALPWWMWLSRSAASRLLAAPMAWKSPVKCRLMSLHRHHLRMAAARRSALHSEARTEAGLAQADQGLLADPVQPIGEPDRRGRLAFAGRGRGNRSDQHELPVLAAGERLEVVEVDLRLRVSVRQQGFAGDPQPVADLRDRSLPRLPGDLDVTLLPTSHPPAADSWAVCPDDAGGRKAAARSSFGGGRIPNTRDARAGVRDRLQPVTIAYHCARLFRPMWVARKWLHGPRCRGKARRERRTSDRPGVRAGCSRLATMPRWHCPASGHTRELLRSGRTAKEWLHGIPEMRFPEHESARGVPGHQIRSARTESALTEPTRC